MGTLYIVGTPIGNLEDITLRALRVLKEVGLIAAEDTRVTRKLLHRHGIHTPLTSYHEHNKLSKLPSLIEALGEKDVALVSDAGMPGVNDPGYELVREASKAGIAVVVVPGPSAVTAAIALSGIAVDQWVYLGFLPRKRSERRRLLESFSGDARACVAFETPHRLASALEDIRGALGDRRIAVCRELTKLHEEVFRGTVSEAIEYFAEPRGEFTLVIEGGATASVKDSSGEDARELLARLRNQGIAAREAVAAAVEQSGLSRREVYRIWLELERAASQ